MNVNTSASLVWWPGVRINDLSRSSQRSGLLIHAGLSTIRRSWWLSSNSLTVRAIITCCDFATFSKELLKSKAWFLIHGRNADNLTMEQSNNSWADIAYQSYSILTLAIHFLGFHYFGEWWLQKTIIEKLVKYIVCTQPFSVYLLLSYSSGSDRDF